MCTSWFGQTMTLAHKPHHQALQQDITHYDCCSETNSCDPICITLEQPGQDHRDQLVCELHRRLPQLWPQAMHRQLARLMQQPCRREAAQQLLLPQSCQLPLLLPIVTVSSALQLQVSPVVTVSFYHHSCQSKLCDYVHLAICTITHAPSSMHQCSYTLQSQVLVCDSRVYQGSHTPKLRTSALSQHTVHALMLRNC